MGKKIQGAKLRAIKRSKLALEELQERQADDIVIKNVLQHPDELFTIDRSGTDFIPHHLRPSNKDKKQLPHKSSTASSTGKFQKKHLSSIDEIKVQKLLNAQQRKGIIIPTKNDTVVTATQVQPKRSHKLIKVIRRDKHKENFDLWNDQNDGNNNSATTITASTSSIISKIEDPDAATITTATAASAGAPSVSVSNSSSSSNILSRTVKLTAEGIRNVVVSTASAIKDTIVNTFTIAPAGIAPIHTITKAVPIQSMKSLKSANAITNDMTKKSKQQSVIVPTSAPIAIDVALTGGQSYHPDPIQHTKLLQTAIEMELSRNAIEEKMNTPISTGMSKETRALLVQDSSDDEDDDDKMDDLDATKSMAVGEIPKRLNKLTKAQRNKLKEQRRKQYEIQLAKKQKQQYNDGEIPKYKKDIQLQIKKSTEKQLQKIQYIQEKRLQPLGTKLDTTILSTTKKTNHNNILLSKPTVPIALTSSSSLRTIQPKGSMIIDRAHSFATRQPSISPLIPTKRTTTATSMNRKNHTSTSSLTNIVKAPHKHRKKRKLSLKGKRNTVTRGDTFEILG